MPLTLVPPAPGRTPFYRVRGHEAGIAVNRSTQTTDKRTANRLLIEWRDAARRIATEGHKPAAPTFAEAALAYLHAGRSERFLKPLIERLGDKSLASITQSTIDATASALYPSASAATRNRQVYSPVSAILRRAGVTISLHRPKGASGSRRLDWLRPEQAFALLRAARTVHPRFAALLTFLLYTGVRLSEALRLDWRDVDFDLAQALIRQTKTGKPVTVHLPRPAFTALESLDRSRARVFNGVTKSGRLYAMWNEAERLGACLLSAG
jgi:integrase